MILILGMSKLRERGVVKRESFHATPGLSELWERPPKVSFCLGRIASPDVWGKKSDGVVSLYGGCNNVAGTANLQCQPRPSHARPTSAK